MRVYLLSILILFFSLRAGASTCEEKVLRKYNGEFQRFLSTEFEGHDSLELFKTVGFLGASSEEGFKMVLNLKLSTLTSSESFRTFLGAAKKFIAKNARLGEDFAEGNGHLYFYPREDDLPCLDDSLFLDSVPAICSIDEIDFKESRVDELKSLLDRIFKEIPQLELKEVDPNPTLAKKSISVLINEKLIKPSEVSLSVTGGKCDMGSTLKKSFSCTVIGGDSMNIKLRVGDLESELTLKVNLDDSYRLDKVGGSAQNYQVLKLSPNGSERVLKAENIRIIDGPCAMNGDEIHCGSNDSKSFRLSVVPDQQESKTLSLDVNPMNGLELRIKSDEDAQYKIISSHVFKDGSENTDELLKVSVENNPNCEIISEVKKIIRCKKVVEPYYVEASYLGVDVISKKVIIGEFSKFSLKTKDSKLDSLSSVSEIIVLGDELEIPPSSYSDLKLGIELKDIKNHKVSYSQFDAQATAVKEETQYKYKVVLTHNKKNVDTKEVSVTRYIAGDNYFFDVVKRSRQCHFKLMKVQGVDEFKTVGQSEFLKNFMEIKVKSKRKSCSSVQKTEDSIQVFCTLRKDKLEEYVTIQLFSNGQQVRGLECHLLNESYFDEEEDLEDRRERMSAGAKSRSKKQKAKMVEDIGDSFSKAFPQFLKSKYQTNQQPIFYNPLMYNYGGYNPQSIYGPGYYQSPGLWNTMYMFDPSTY